MKSILNKSNTMFDMCLDTLEAQIKNRDEERFRLIDAIENLEDMLKKQTQKNDQRKFQMEQMHQQLSRKQQLIDQCLRKIFDLQLLISSNNQSNKQLNQSSNIMKQSKLIQTQSRVVEQRYMESSFKKSMNQQLKILKLPQIESGISILQSLFNYLKKKVKEVEVLEQSNGRLKNLNADLLQRQKNLIDQNQKIRIRKRQNEDYKFKRYKALLNTHNLIPNFPRKMPSYKNR